MSTNPINQHDIKRFCAFAASKRGIIDESAVERYAVGYLEAILNGTNSVRVELRRRIQEFIKEKGPSNENPR